MMAGDKNLAFDEAYAKLNPEQKRAVDLIDGPVMVVAGPGTGKTQLLTARVANILRSTDTLPQNILCLTFTESGAENMRERLTSYIGQAAYDVNMGTYHAFGSDLIRRFPEYFSETRLQNPIDELSKRQVLIHIVDRLSYHNPLKQTRHHIGDLISTISEVKRALLAVEDLQGIAAENAKFIQDANLQISKLFDGFVKMPSKLDKAIPYFISLLQILQKNIPENPINPRFGSLARIAADELTTAIDEAENAGKTNPLTKWKNTWLAKDADNRFIFAGELENRRISALADVLERYQNALATAGLYDYDDMIIRAINALEKYDDLRFTLQEQYQYVLLDEFQDTNAAQLKLVQLLTDNPVNEGRPNVLAVGDDDQAIYAFQGAQYSNMLDFYKMFRDVKVINLTENYRSRSEILLTAQNISKQINNRLQVHFPGMSKKLVQSNSDLPGVKISRNEFLSDIGQHDFIAQQVASLIKQGTKPSEIAVLAPKHKFLETLVPYLNNLKVPVRYEKRENILDTPVVQQLITMSRLVLALRARDEALANALWPIVLSYDFWNVPTSTIWQLSWQVSDGKEHKLSWSKLLLNSESDKCRIPALLFLALADKADNETCEAILDYLIGSEEINPREADNKKIRSPLRAYYTNPKAQTDNAELFYETLSHLMVLRAKLRDYQATQESALRLADLMIFIEMYEEADERMQSTNPYNQHTDAVQLMTVFKAKGLEFEHVFIVACQDEVWGGSARGNNNKLTLPANLAPIRHAGATDDERLRILFVALTRAKFGLYLTSYTNSFNGNATKRLKYLDEIEQADGNFDVNVLPDKYKRVISDSGEPPVIELLQIDWRHRHASTEVIPKLQSLLQARLKHYQLSPTHLNTFTDMEYGGPQSFFFDVLLKFPHATSPSIQFGNAIHETLEWYQHQIDAQAQPGIQTAVKYFASRVESKKLTREQLALEIERGEKALTGYLGKKAGMFKPGDRAEFNFKREGSFVGKVHLSGKIDRMEIDRSAKTITVIDYKTGKSYAKWESNGRLHKYRQQLYCYKLLIENSHTFNGYVVTGGRLEFIEPDADGRINALDLVFKEVEMQRTNELLKVMWQHVHKLDFPDIQAYPTTLTGTRQFEQDLLEGKI
ncbi:MAG TPA: ATP-dependent DNA helicase [Candidatus Saccharimonadales bacterium]|nr:ATP-dependent DNA helicase [Candidatus Saccharimonadales bacterium]